MMELIEMNNMAVCALQHGRPKKAHDLLSTALSSIKDHFAKRQQEVVQKSTMPTPPGLPAPSPPLSVETSPLQLQIPICVSSLSLGTEFGSSDDDRSFGMDTEEDNELKVPSVFSVTGGVVSSLNDGLVLNYNKSLMVLHSLNDLDVLTSVVLYNIAIVKHGRAMERGSSTLLTEALRFYKMATHVIKSKQDIDRASDYVLLVSYHNMAHIYSSRFCPAEMSGCFDAARFLLAQESTQQFLDEDDMEFFAMGVLLDDHKIQFAPAA
jgi:hypothetical protein